MLKLPKNISVNESHSLREILEEGIEGNDPIEINMSEVEVADTSGVQLLVSAKATIEVAGKSVVFLGRNKVIEDAFKRIGITGTDFQSIIPSFNEQDDNYSR